MRVSNRCRRWLTVACVAGFTVISVSSAVAAPSSSRRVEGHYVAKVHDPFAAALLYTAARSQTKVLCRPEAGGTDLGGVCFDVAPGDTRAEFSIADLSGGLVVGRVHFGNPMTDHGIPFCGSTSVAIPSGARRVVIALESTYVTSGGCGAPAGRATTGRVIGVFR